jgi:hypothetical protein
LCDIYDAKLRKIKSSQKYWINIYRGLILDAKNLNNPKRGLFKINLINQLEGKIGQIA